MYLCILQCYLIYFKSLVLQEFRQSWNSKWNWNILHVKVLISYQFSHIKLEFRICALISYVNFPFAMWNWHNLHAVKVIFSNTKQ